MNLDHSRCSEFNDFFLFSLSGVIGPYLHLNTQMNLGDNFAKEFSIEVREPSGIGKSS